MTTNTAAATKTHRYVSKCKGCKTVTSYLSTDKPDRYGFGIMWGETRRHVTCTCGKQQYAKVVRGRYDAKVACNAKCMHAASADCTCSCGGMNHAADYQGE